MISLLVGDDIELTRSVTHVTGKVEIVASDYILIRDQWEIIQLVELTDAGELPPGTEIILAITP